MPVGLMAAAVAARRSRTMLGRRAAAMRWLGSSSARPATARIGVRIDDVGEASGKRAVLAEVRSIVVAGIVGLGFVDKELPVLADCTATFCSCLGTVPRTVAVRLGVEGSLGIRHGIAVVVDRSCRIVVHCQSSSFPCHLGDS